MKIKLKGLNRVRKRLADGTPVTYYYAWKGGPRLPGKPGSPEFIAAFNEAVRQKVPPKADALGSIFDRFESSSEFDKLAAKTKQDYRSHIRALAAEFGTFPTVALADARTRSVFLDHRDAIAQKSLRLADYRFAVFARVLSWAADRGLTTKNPLERPGRVYRSGRRELIWTADDEAVFMAAAPAHLHLALTLALWTGQRQGDLLGLTWAAYDGAKITLKQSKTGARLKIPAGAPLRAALDQAKAAARLDAERRKRDFSEADKILITTHGTGWTQDGFRASWRKACAEAKITGVTFHDLRGTAVTRLALAGCEVPEIASITGHSLKDAAAILETHYLARDPKLAESAIQKLEKTLQNSQPDSQPGNPDQEKTEEVTVITMG
ncbi:site-specific integrase [Paracoccaceae bacterium Fryx2]|nr:site-specific integrase [Paracoccaceae bacterium Fryx2]